MVRTLFLCSLHSRRLTLDPAVVRLLSQEPPPSQVVCFSILHAQVLSLLLLRDLMPPFSPSPRPATLSDVPSRLFLLTKPRLSSPSPTPNLSFFHPLACIDELSSTATSTRSQLAATSPLKPSRSFSQFKESCSTPTAVVLTSTMPLYDPPSTP